MRGLGGLGVLLLLRELPQSGLRHRLGYQGGWGGHMLVRVVEGHGWATRARRRDAAVQEGHGLGGGGGEGTAGGGGHCVCGGRYAEGVRICGGTGNAGACGECWRAVQRRCARSHALSFRLSSSFNSFPPRPCVCCPHLPAGGDTIVGMGARDREVGREN